MGKRDKQNSISDRRQMSLFERKEEAPSSPLQQAENPALTEIPAATQEPPPPKIPRCPRCGAEARASARAPGYYYCVGLPACTEGDDIFRFML
jgi:hypothetical protein